MTATCALHGCSEPVRAPKYGRTKFCSEEHAEQSRREHQKMRDRAAYKRKMAAREAEPEALPKRGRPESTQEAANRQQPPQRTHKLIFDPRVVLRPPVDVERPPGPFPFYDDLNAVLDHGSPGKPAVPLPRGYASQWTGGSTMPRDAAAPPPMTEAELERDAIGSYYDAVRAIGAAIKAGERELPPMFVARERAE